MTTASMSGVEELKARGNASFAEGRFEEAVSAFTEAIAQDAENAVLHSNRSAALASLQRWPEAVEDARRTTQLRPDWGKGWGRLGSALQGAGDVKGARDAFEAGLRVDPENAQLARGLEATRRTAAPARDFANPFAAPDVLERLRRHPKTAHLLQDPMVLGQLAELQRDPAALGRHLQSPHMMEVLTVLLGIDEGNGGGAGEETTGSTGSTGTETATGTSKGTATPTHPTHTPTHTHTSTHTHPSKHTPTPTPAPTPTPLSPEEQEAQRLKELGTEAYRRRDFDAALALYQEAAQLVPNKAALLLNQSAVHFEAGRYAEAISAAEEAVAAGRAQPQPMDFAFYGRAYARVAAAHARQDALDEAVRWYGKSLAEHRCAETLARLRETERLVAERARAALQDPQLAEAARAEGNAAFRAGRYADAVAAYTEAVRRDAQDARALSNRAACYLKLGAVPEGLRDCDAALLRDVFAEQDHLSSPQHFIGQGRVDVRRHRAPRAAGPDPPDRHDLHVSGPGHIFGRPPVRNPRCAGRDPA